MFTSKARRALDVASSLDFTREAKQPTLYALGHVKHVGIGSQVTAIAHDPVQSLLACGTEAGTLHVFGRPSVQLDWHLGVPVKIKHLTFKSGSGFLCVVGKYYAKDTLSVFDLGRIDNGKPFRDASLSLRSNITAIESHPSIPFLFLAGKDGTVDVYDIDRSCLCPHARIPNLWLAQEEILRRSGIIGAPSRRHIPFCIDVKCHPLDINLVLVAYEGGVSLWNIAEQRAERNWEFVLPPGAPGGGNDGEDTIFNERRPSITCVAWRPDGLVFAAGHEDGCISFASVEDEMAIDIRVLERSSVNKTTEQDLFVTGRQVSNREPIFKLAWSGFPAESILDRATAAWNATSTTRVDPLQTGAVGPELQQQTHVNGTMLTVLGGLLPHDPMGVHVLELPNYQAPSGPTQTHGNLSAPAREALKQSVTPQAHHLYLTSAPPEDFCLFPRSSPYYGLSFDPTSIVIIVGTDGRLPVLPTAHSSRTIEAWSFPPSSTTKPVELDVPTALCFNGSGTCSSTQLFNVPTLTHRRMLHQFDMQQDEFQNRIQLDGGKSTSKRKPNRTKLTPPSDNQPRILLTSHIDLRIKFWDVSSELLVTKTLQQDELSLNSSPNQLMNEFPRQLKHLDWDLKQTLLDATTKELESSRLLRERPWELEIDKVCLAKETLEVAVSLNTGDILVARLGYGEQRDAVAVEFERAEAQGQLNDTVNEALQDMQLQDTSLAGQTSTNVNFDARALQSGGSGGSFPGRKLSSGRRPSSAAPSSTRQLELNEQAYDLSATVISKPFHDGFRPFAAFTLPSVDKETCLELSDCGFLAASNGCVLLIADLRGPDVLMIQSLANGAHNGIGKGKSKVKPDESPITSLTWTICPTNEDHDTSPRLIVVQTSGQVRIFELSNLAGSWHVGENPSVFHHDSVAGAFKTFVLDKTGQQLLAEPMALERALAQQAGYVSNSNELTKGSLSSLWITINENLVSCYFNIDGPRTAQFEGGTSAGFLNAQMTTRFGCPVLLVASKHRTITALSLPDLTEITRMSFEAAVHSSAGMIDFCSDGDLVQHIDPLHIALFTTCDIARWQTKVELWDPTIPIPWQTTMFEGVANVFSSLFGGKKVYSASEVENILGGPKRPAPKQRDRAQQAVAVAPPTSQKPKPQPTTSSNPSTRQRQTVQGQATTTQSILASTQEALGKRGEYLDYMQERLGSVANDAANFAKETKKAAQREAAKRSLMGGVTSFFNK
ncbi:Lethal(2) giant larvae sro7 [Microbotryomycetes sp. JL221]|nr:Lethal(2) giant larvae sro7 [Microbotryomycetes sp. JL221]